MKNIKKKEVYIGNERVGNSVYKTITDADTGELLHEGWLNESKNKLGRKSNEPAYFVKLYKSNLIQITSEKARDRRLELDEAGLLFMLLSISGWQTPYIADPVTGKNMNCSEIADFLGRDRMHIHDLLERLVAKGMLSKVVNGNGRANHYMINPNVAFYGRTIDDINHLDVFKNCAYIPKKYINYRKTPDKNK
jgi:DNA-binding MarR family transcriptional regulator